MTLTNNESSVVDTTELTVRRSISIAAPVEKVWAAVTQPEHISRWFGRTELDGSGVGACGTFSWPEHGPVPFRVEALDARRTVSYRWGNDDARGSFPAELDVEGSTVFTFTLEPEAGGTRLTVVETGFAHTSDPLGNLESHRQGWDAQLDRLVAQVERVA